MKAFGGGQTPGAAGPWADGSGYAPMSAFSGGGGMGDLLSSLLPSVIGAGADIFSARQNAQGNQEANQLSLQSAREQMAFQERMSNTAHQRETDDLRKAGLNPVLGMNSGASTPVGGSVEYQNQKPNYSGIAAKGIQTAMELQQMKKTFEKMDVDIASAKLGQNLIKAQTDATKQSARSSAADASLKESDYEMRDLKGDAVAYLRRLLEKFAETARKQKLKINREKFDNELRRN